MSVVDKIFEEIEFRAANNETLPNFDEFIEQIKFLETSEKDELRKRTLEMEWSIGAPRIFAALNKIKVFRMPIYILRQEPNKAQSILNDLLEVEYDLLADLVQVSYGNSALAIKIYSLLEECILRLIQDLMENPNILKNNYFTELKEILKFHIIQPFQTLHMNMFLKIETKSLKEAFSDKSILEMNRDKTTSYSLLISEIVAMKGFFNNILLLARDVDFTGWTFFFILLNQYLLDNTNLGVVGRIQNEVQNLFKQSKNNNCWKSFFQMMLIAKFVCKNHSSILGSYPEWYRLTFGDLRYRFKSDYFKKIMEYLNELGQLETDTEIIQIHIDTAIPAPVNCNEDVLNYKQFLRVRLSELESSSTLSCENLSMSFEEEIQIN